MYRENGRYPDVFEGRGVVGNQDVVLRQWLDIFLMYPQIDTQRLHKRTAPEPEQGEIKTLD
jgi:hypothetical protein